MPNIGDNHYTRAEELAETLAQACRAGESVNALAKRYGIRREAIQTVLVARGVLESTPGRDAVLTYVRENPGATVSDIARAMSVPMSTVSRYLRGTPEKLLVVSRKPNQEQRYSDEVVLEALRTAWRLLEGTGRRGLSRTGYMRVMADYTDAPSATVFVTRWASWAEACSLAGVPSGEKLRNHYERQFSDEDLLDAVADFIRITGQQSYRTYGEWARENGRPSGPLLRQRIGLWSDVRTRAMHRTEADVSDAPSSAPPVETAATFTVPNGGRTIRFQGIQLSSSTSFRPGSPRWTEFSLYRTKGGSYVLSRIGRTLVFHSPDCDVAARGGLDSAHRSRLAPSAVPCDRCGPHSTSDRQVLVEQTRYWAQVCSSADDVVRHAHKRDRGGTVYLTAVAARLLEEAAQFDLALHTAYHLGEVA